MTDQYIEIERKFLVKKLPELTNAKKAYIHQGYLTQSSDSVEIRLRRKDEQYFITVKSGSGMVRTERETSIDQQQFETLWPDTQGKRIEKNRWTGKLNTQLSYELDVFLGELDHLMLVEVEFSSLEQADQFEPADWFGREVTIDKSYQNKALAMNPQGIKI
ncbi:MAG: CYTH domain-containing protein [Gammaproteobacteria bacterium]|nr:CYTH domain-containing protein [Gammaproteobacteria bacterium]